MGTLTGQQINNTYDGLLKLADSTTGITSSFQAIEDGLGNNTGSRISTQGITSPNIVNVKTTLVPDYMGNGFGTTAIAPVANTQNRLVYGMFYDTGVHSYSAITYNLNTLSSTSDVVNFYFYSLQLGSLVGIGPKDLIMSGITLESSVPSVTGITTTVLPSTLSFSGTGGGWYIYAYYISNSGVTPTIRYNSPITASHLQGGIPLNPLGNYITVTNNGTGVGSRYLQFANIGTPITINNLAVQPSYSENDILINTILNIGTPSLGFSLKVIK
jgi:hypothetical protein